MTTIGNKLYLGGKIKYAAEKKYGGAVFSYPDGKRLSSGLPIDSSENVVVTDGAGGWYVGGAFNRVSDGRKEHLVHILPDHTLDERWQLEFKG